MSRLAIALSAAFLFGACVGAAPSPASPSQPPATEDADPVHTALTFERSHALNVALAAITTDQRTAIVLFDVEGYDYAEIASMTGVSLGTVKSRIHRGRLALRDLLADRMDLFRG